jgi:hypothetical protein
MAHFRGTIKGGRGAVSRLGHKNTGLSASLNGWRLGCEVELSYDARRGKDVVTVYKTSGSSGRWARRQVAKFSIPPNEERTHDGTTS